MSREIELSRGMVAIVDDEDYEWLSQWKWHAHKSRSQWYACRNDYSDEKIRIERMHRVIINAPDGVIVDHINRNSLDNRRSNLRLSTHRENFYNSVWFENYTPVPRVPRRKTPKSRIPQRKGVRVTGTFRMRHETWQITLTVARVADKDKAEQIRGELLAFAKVLVQE